MKRNELEEVFTSGAKLIDNLDIYKNLDGKHIKYTNELIKRTAELDATEKSLKNMRAEINKVKMENDNIVNTLKSIHDELNIKK